MSKKVYLASDHAGFDLKEALMPFLKERGYEVEDAHIVINYAPQSHIDKLKNGPR